MRTLRTIGVERARKWRLRLARQPFVPTRRDAGRLLFLVPVVVFAIGAVIGLRTVSSAGQGDFYQDMFVPAVMFACGHGFENVNARPDDLSEFLTRQDTSYSCSPALANAERLPESVTAGGMRYLIATAGMIWRVAGIRWSALWPLFGIFAGLAALGIYGILRVALPRGIAATGALWLVGSAPHAQMIPHLRDYSKAAFILPALALCAYLFQIDPPRRRTFLVAGTAGALLGIGFGFRTDMLAPLLVVVVAVCLSPSEGMAWKPRLAAVAGAVLVFALCAAPALPVYLRNGAVSTMGVHGVTHPFTERLGLHQDLYHVGELYLDAYAIALSNAHIRTHQPTRPYANLEEPGLESASSALMASWARTFPADVAVRGLASLRETLDLGAARMTDIVQDVARRLGPLQPAMSAVVSPIASPSLGVALSVVGFAVLLAVSVPAALLYAFTYLFLGGLGAFQFHERHVFHLEVLAWLALALAFRGLTGLIRHARVHGMTTLATPWLLRRVWIPTLCAVLLPWLGLTAARAYQEPQAERLLTSLSGLSVVSVDTHDSRDQDGRTLIRFDAGQLWRGRDGIRHALLAFTLGGDGCESLRPVVRVAYDAAPPTDFGFPVGFTKGRGEAAEVRLIVFDGAPSRFRGLEVASADRNCVRDIGFARLDQPPAMLVNLVLPPGWRDRPLYQRFSAPSERLQLILAGDAVAPREQDLRRLADDLWQSAQYVDPAVEHTEEGWRMDAGSPPRNAYLMQSPPLSLEPSDTVVVRGTLHSGSLGLGLQSENRWTVYSEVNTPGEFVTALSAQEASDSLVITNGSAGGAKVEITGVNIIRQHRATGGG